MCIVSAKVDAVWGEGLLVMGRCYKGAYDSSLLSLLGKLLQSGLENKRRHIKNRAVEWWNDTFGRASSLEYPDYLVPTLHLLRDKVCVCVCVWCNSAPACAGIPSESPPPCPDQHTAT